MLLKMPALAATMAGFLYSSGFVMAKSKPKLNAGPGNVVTVAVVQAASVAFDRKCTLEKVLDLTGDAAIRGAKLVLFPEAFVSGYPRGLDFGAVVGARSEEG